MENLPTLTKGRADLHTFLTAICENVYFQAPDNTRMNYPCIRYDIDDEQRVHADNRPYLQNWRYEVMVIDRDPDSEIRDMVALLPMCKFERKYIADDLHHFVFNLFF